MKTKLHPDTHTQSHALQLIGPPPGWSMSKSLRALALGTALCSFALLEAKAGNILDNDLEHGFKPAIAISHHSSQSVVIDRSGNGPLYGKAANPVKISATVVGNLTGFPFTEIAEDMAVSLRVGDFGFAATLGEDTSRAKNRDGTLRPFDPKKTTAVYLLRAELPPLTAGGPPRYRTVGSVKFAWNLTRVSARLVLSDVAAAEADGIMAADEESFPEGNASLAFSREKIPVELTFGSAEGSRIAYARGRLTTSLRQFGSARTGNLAIVPLHSLAMIGEGDITAPTVAARIPTIDEAPLGVISFNGTVTDVAALPLTGEVDPIAIHVRVNDVPLVGGPDDLQDFGLYLTDHDARGQCIFSVVNLPIAAGEAGTAKVSVYATDASGNQSRILETRVTVRGSGLEVPVAAAF